MEAMMEDFRRFPPFQGHNTHFAMHRRRVKPAG